MASSIDLKAKQEAVEALMSATRQTFMSVLAIPSNPEMLQLAYLIKNIDTDIMASIITETLTFMPVAKIVIPSLTSSLNEIVAFSLKGLTTRTIIFVSKEKDTRSLAAAIKSGVAAALSTRLGVSTMLSIGTKQQHKTMDSKRIQYKDAHIASLLVQDAFKLSKTDPLNKWFALSGSARFTNDYTANKLGYVSIIAYAAQPNAFLIRECIGGTLEQQHEAIDYVYSVLLMRGVITNPYL